MQKIRVKKIQEKLWQGSFGSNYHYRNNTYDRRKSVSIDLKKNKIKFKDCLEVGANIGLNLNAIKKKFPKSKLYGLEINKKAFSIMKKKHEGFNLSFLDFNIEKKFDLVFTYGFLIHQNPNDLKKIYKKLYNYSNKYIYISEYFSNNPTMVDYRGKKNQLFLRDYAFEFLKVNKKAKLVDYGFHWAHDPKVKGHSDSINWFLFKK